MAPSWDRVAATSSTWPSMAYASRECQRQPRDRRDAAMQSHESPHAQVKDEERDEVYFDEFCNMLDALEEREKREKKEREALLIREALTAPRVV